MSEDLNPPEEKSDVPQFTPKERPVEKRLKRKLSIVVEPKEEDMSSPSSIEKLEKVDIPKGSPIVKCPYNTNHLATEATISFHIKICPDRPRNVKRTPKVNKCQSVIPKLTGIVIPPSPPDIKPVYTTGLIPLGHLGPTYIVSPLTSYSSPQSSSSSVEEDVSSNNTVNSTSVSVSKTATANKEAANNDNKANTSSSPQSSSPANKKRKVNE